LRKKSPGIVWRGAGVEALEGGEGVLFEVYRMEIPHG
jgi:hypothetical protein